MMEETVDNRSSRAKAVVATVGVHVVVLFVCLTVWLRYPRPGVPTPKEEDKQTEITFEEVVELVAGGNYVEADLVISEEPKLAMGSNVESAPALPPEPTQEEIKQQKHESISKLVTFKTSDQTPVEGDGGKDEKTVPTESLSSTEFIGPEGYSLGYNAQPHGNKEGIIAIKIKFNKDGKIIDAQLYTPETTYYYLDDPQAVKNCINTALNSSWINLPANAPATDNEGLIKYRF